MERHGIVSFESTDTDTYHSRQVDYILTKYTGRWIAWQLFLAAYAAGHVYSWGYG
jgi:hypothetical protein